MAKITVVVELETNEDDMQSLIAIERAFGRLILKYAEQNDYEVTHLEAARGDMKAAWGI